MRLSEKHTSGRADGARGHVPESQHPARDVSVYVIKVVVTDRPPGGVVEDLETPVGGVGTASEPRREG